MEAFLRSVPRITLFLVGSSFILSLLLTYHLISPSSLTLSARFYKKYEIYRLLTTFIHTNTFSIPSLISLMLFYNASKHMELTGSAQYLYFITLIYFSCLFLTCFMSIPLFSQVFYLALVYVNCRKNRGSRLAVLGLPIQISAAYLPYIFLILNPSYAHAIGMILGHIYYYFEEVYPKLPRSHNVRVFNTPMAFFKISNFLRL